MAGFHGVSSLPGPRLRERDQGNRISAPARGLAPPTLHRHRPGPPNNGSAPRSRERPPSRDASEAVRGNDVTQESPSTLPASSPRRLSLFLIKRLFLLLPLSPRRWQPTGLPATPGLGAGQPSPALQSGSELHFCLGVTSRHFPSRSNQRPRPPSFPLSYWPAGRRGGGERRGVAGGRARAARGLGAQARRRWLGPGGGPGLQTRRWESDDAGTDGASLGLSVERKAFVRVPAENEAPARLPQWCP